jgi:hypothetical protein
MPFGTTRRKSVRKRTFVGRFGHDPSRAVLAGFTVLYIPNSLVHAQMAPHDTTVRRDPKMAAGDTNVGFKGG